MTVIIDYGVGNLSSILNMLKKIGKKNVVISSDQSIILDAEKLILPGVGHFDYGMKLLKSTGIIDALNTSVLHKKKPILGICLGAQLLLDGSEEGAEQGLGYIQGNVVKFDQHNLGAGLKIPHMGWADVSALKDSNLIHDLPPESRFYFVHSFHMKCANAADELLSATYGYPFTAAVEKENILGVQFHPEKSHKFGMALLKNFIENY